MTEREQPPIQPEKEARTPEIEVPAEVLDTIREVSREFGPQMIELRRQIHENPELGFQEHKTAKRVVEQLRSMGIEEIDEGIGGTGVVAYIRGSKEGGPLVALRADMDALPVKEASGVEFASKKEGAMHACGHDAHTAGLVGAAKILTQLREQGQLSGDVLLIFQPNEERATNARSGAVAIIKHLEKKGEWSKVRLVHAAHVYSELPVGTAMVREGLMLAGSSRYDWKIKAPGGHGMDVHGQPTPNLMAVRAVGELDRKYNPQEPQSGPNEIVFNPTDLESEEPHRRYNITGRHVDIRGTLRVLSADDPKAKRRGFMEDARQAIARAIEPWQDLGAEAELHFIPGTPPVVHRHPEQVQLAEQAARDVIGQDTQFDRQPVPGGEDFAFYLEKFRGREVPGSFIMIGAANPDEDIPFVQHHNSKFKIDESVIPRCAAILAEMAVLSIKHEQWVGEDDHPRPHNS